MHNGIPTTVPGSPPFSVLFIFAISSGLPHKNAEGVLKAYQCYREVVRDGENGFVLAARLGGVGRTLQPDCWPTNRFTLRWRRVGANW